MLRSYFLIAWRGLVKNRVYSTINILGLAIGMGVVLLISLWMLDELNYNKTFPHYDRVVQVVINSTHGNDVRTLFSLPVPLVMKLRAQYGGDFSQVSAASFNSSHVLKVGDKQLSMNGMYVEPEMMTILDLRLLDGRKAVLEDPASIVISQSLSKALFGVDNAEGKTLQFDDSTVFKVGGVYADLPYNSDFRAATFFAPWANYASTHPFVKDAVNYWNNNGFQGFALLQDHAQLDAVGAKVKGALDGHKRTDKPEVLLFPMSRWHLYGDFVGGKNVGGNIQFVRMFGVIGVFVVLLACINFMNLSTARSEKRAKEVGVRKSVGSMRGQLIGQFLGESVFVAVLAFGLSLLLVELALPWFNEVADKQMHIFWGSPRFWGLAVGGTLVVGLIAGSYPAFYLSSFNPVKVLKGDLTRSRTRQGRGTKLLQKFIKLGRLAALPRQVLIVVQFTVSVALIIGTVIVFQQIIYVKDRPIGYDREGLITVNILNPAMIRHFDALRDDLLRSGAAVNVAMSSSPTTNVYNNQSGFTWEGKDPNLSPSFAVIWGSYDFGATVGWQFVAGRDFSRNFATDSAAIVLNETAVKYIGLKDPVGATIRYTYSSRADQNYHVIGVIRDMVMADPFGPPKQSVFFADDVNAANVITVKMNPSLSASKALAVIGAIFKKYDPEVPFGYTFNSEDYAQKFVLEERVGKLAGFFTVFAIFISCLGLFGLASFVAEQRVKEIGVRKVLGASVGHLWGLLSRDFLLLVGVSFFISVPLAWRVMSGWLERYPYRVTISVWVILGTMVAALLITLVTVSWQAVRAARANPVRSLRTE